MQAKRVEQRRAIPRTRGRRGVGPTYLHKRGHSHLFLGSTRGRSHLFTQKGALSLIFNHWRQASQGEILGAWAGGGSAGSVLRSQGSSEEDGVFALCARGGFDRFQCSLQPGPALASGSVSPIYTKKGTLYTMALSFKWLCGPGLALAGRLGEEERSRCARGDRVIAFNARSSPVPLPPRRGVGLSNGSAGSVLRSQGSSEEDGAFALRARGRLDRFQCSLRTDPAPPRRGVGLTYLHKRGHSLLLLMGPSCQRVGE